MPITIAEQIVPVRGLAPVTTNGGASSDYVRIDRDVRCTCVVQLTQAVGHATVLTIYQADDNADTNAEVLQNSVPIWECEDAASSSVLERQTDAKNYTVDADIKNKIVVFQLDPQYVTRPWVKITASDSSEATNLISVLFLHEVNHAGDEVASLI